MGARESAANAAAAKATSANPVASKIGKWCGPRVIGPNLVIELPIFLLNDALKQALDKWEFDAAFGGARRDEEKSRAKERIFSFRSAGHGSRAGSATPPARAGPG